MNGLFRRVAVEPRRWPAQDRFPSFAADPRCSLLIASGTRLVDRGEAAIRAARAGQAAEGAFHGADEFAAGPRDGQFERRRLVVDGERLAARGAGFEQAALVVVAATALLTSLRCASMRVSRASKWPIALARSCSKRSRCFSVSAMWRSVWMKTCMDNSPRCVAASRFGCRDAGTGIGQIQNR